MSEAATITHQADTARDKENARLLSRAARFLAIGRHAAEKALKITQRIEAEGADQGLQGLRTTARIATEAAVEICGRAHECTLIAAIEIDQTAGAPTPPKGVPNES